MRALDAKRMRKLKEKNLPKALETINKANMQNEQLVLGQLNTKLELAQPKVTDQELYDIQKFANSGLNPNINVDGKSTTTKGGATALLMESNYSIRDELMSTITTNKQQSLLEKRAKITSEKLMKDAQDLMVFQNQQSALLGEENQKLNNDLNEMPNKMQKVEEYDQESEFKAPASVHNKLTSKNL